MGHDITSIGNHRLNTENVKVLAEDICSRIDVNIEYGYLGCEEHFKLLGEDRNSGFVILGRIVKSDNFKTLHLTDEYYQLKQLYEKYGDSILYDPRYWYWREGDLPHEKNIVEERKKITMPNFELATPEEKDISYYECFLIYKEHYVSGIPSYTRWWSFCRYFIESTLDELKSMEKLFEYRKQLMEYTLAFGGGKIYYVDDQNPTLEGVGQGAESEISWSELEKIVEEKASPLLLNIPLFLTDKTYRFEFLKKKEYPLAFVDNFSDIK